MPTSNESLIDRFYAAFAESDGAGMAASYAPDIEVSDPVFTDLHGAEAGAMWRMLTGQARDLRVELARAEGRRRARLARWRAQYTFSRTGRPVVNDVRASFRFADGLIAEHRDEFDFHRWARQALGAPGLLLGWTPMLRSKVRKQARAGLDEFMSREAPAST